MIPQTPASYICRVLASLPKSNIDRLTPRFFAVARLRKKTVVAEGHKKIFGGVGCKPGVGTNVGFLAIIVESFEFTS